MKSFQIIIQTKLCKTKLILYFCLALVAKPTETFKMRPVTVWSERAHLLFVNQTSHIRTHFGTKQPVPLSLISKANEDAEFDTLRIWIVLKQLYKRNTVIYNLSYKTLSNQTGISHTTLRKHIRIMFENKWVKWTKNGHLILISINKLKKHKYETCVLVPVCKQKSEQILQLRKVIIHRNIKNQEKRIFDKREIVNNCGRANGKLSPKQRKKINQAGGILNFEKQINSVTTLSNKSIGKLFTKKNGLSLSQITGHRIQKGLRVRKLIQTKTRLELISKNSTPDYCKYANREKGGYIFNPNSKELFRRLSNEIRIGAIV